jgi:hypothetical protein
MNHLPPISEMFTPAEIQMSFEEEVRLLDDRPRVVRWFVAPGGTPPPAPEVEGLTFATDWLDPWRQLNDPAHDRLDGVLIVDRGDPSGRSGGLLVLTRPTEDAKLAWNVARSSGLPLTLGAEREADPGYRAIFPVVYAIPPVPGSEHLRFSVPAPMDETPAWKVFAVEGLPPRSFE